MCNFVVYSVPADGLALAGKLMTKFGPPIYTELAFIELTRQIPNYKIDKFQQICTS